ncbi:MAG: RNA 2',3'-cyclic phosphodiesterase [Candidatus Aenigmarchaeota archaeon]|nr:RNA 2',3'-cyclic phosphodiesterase [Candidatus Aenigmarchaeota archaeon]
MRCFIGIDISDDLKEKIAKIQKRFSNFDIKLVEKENLHINLIFLGDIENDKIDLIKKIMNKISLKPFKVNINGAGAFPSLDYIRVVWLNIEPKENIIEMYNLLKEGLKQLGFSEEKSYVPHLTIGRVKSNRNKDKLTSLIKEQSYIGEMEISSIILFKSNLTPNGPVYEKLYVKKFI